MLNEFFNGSLPASDGGGGLYVDDVFSTFLYEGNAGGQGANAQSISNGVDLSGEGGLVWIKNRSLGSSAAWGHYWFDTERGAGKYLTSNGADQEQTIGNSLTAFNSDGFTLGEVGGTNNNGSDYVSWTFRKAPGFFDVVTYTGNGSSTGDSQTISHNLGSTPGFVIIKRTSDTGDWVCWHRSISTGQPGKYLELDSTNATGTMGVDIWGTVSSTEFEVKHNGTVGDSYEINKNGETYVAYFFAHDDQSFGTNSDEAIIKCGSFTVDASNRIQPVDLDFEPQFLILKMSNANSNWFMYDIMRGLPVINGAPLVNLSADWTGAERTESTTNNTVSITATGFTQGAGFGPLNAGSTGVYIAIRRPNKPPTAGTDVFASVAYAGSSNPRTVTGAGFAPDYVWLKDRTGGANGWHQDRLRGTYSLDSSAGSKEQDRSTYLGPLGQDGAEFVAGGFDANRAGRNHIAHFFKRAPGAFDVTTYDIDTSAPNYDTIVKHNLGVAPELIIDKRRDDTGAWYAWHKDLGSTFFYLRLNETSGISSYPSMFGPYDNPPGPTQFQVRGFGIGAGSHVSYLFATVPGVSKVGSYSGSGNQDVQVDCGFTAGARYVMIKRTNDNGDWYVWDAARGIVAGDDPYLLLNTAAAEVTNTDYIDPYSAGFTVTAAAPPALNGGSGTYIYVAIA